MARVDLLKSNHRKSKAEIVRRVLWASTWALTCRWTPRVLNPWRIAVLRLFGARLGRRVLIFGSVRIDMPWNLEIGNFSAVGRRTWLYNFGRIRIGSNTIVSQDCTICTATHDQTRADLPLFWRDILIGDEAWVAAECFVMPGVEIGTGCVVGARSLVTKDLPEWTVCVGNPCRPIKERKLSDAI